MITTGPNALKNVNVARKPWLCTSLLSRILLYQACPVSRPYRSYPVMYRYTSRFCLLLSVSWATLSPTICAQPLPNGIQLGNPAHGVSIVVPPSMTQCESFLVYYNITSTTSPFIAFYRSDVLRDALLTLLPPAPAVGYCTSLYGANRFCGRDRALFPEPKQRSWRDA